MNSLPKRDRKNIPRSVREMSKEMLQETLKKKRECNAKALEVVEKLCEASVDENWFLDNLQFINQCHFEDITIERSISHMCGYPLCDKPLLNVPAQQYHISTRYNKVFDITERKNFCSSICYKAATYVKKQLFTSPLWFRDQEVIPKYTVLKSAKTSMGEEVVSLSDKMKTYSDDKSMNDINKINILEKNLEDLEEKYANLRIDYQKVENKIPEGIDKSSTDNEKKENKKDIVNINEKVNCVKEEKVQDENHKFTESCDKENLNMKEISSSDQIKNTKVKKESKNKPKAIDSVSKVEKSFDEWFTLETYFCLFGEEKLKENFSDKAEEIKQVLNSKLSMASQKDKIDRMIQLYGLLDTGSFSKKEIKTNLKPLPDYTALKKEINAVDVKVRAFYHGQIEVNPPSAEEAEEGKAEKKETTEDNEEVIYLPLIDAHSVVSHRRKIVLDKLNRVLPDLVKIFTTDYILQINEVRCLVTTFKLSPHNITFKPTEWYLVGIIILKLLSLKDKKLEHVLKVESSESQILLILASFNLQKDFLDNLIVNLTDSKNLMKKLNEFNS